MNQLEELKLLLERVKALAEKRKPAVKQEFINYNPLLERKKERV